MLRWLFLLSLALAVLSEGDDHGHGEEGAHSEEGDDHGHGEEEAHSEVEECATKMWCYSGKDGEKAKCYDKNDNTDFCMCSEGGSYNSDTQKCDTSKRDKCNEYKTSIRAFYGGKCYNEEECKEEDKDNPGVEWVWVNRTVAKCAPKRTLCAYADHASWNDTTKTCVCEDGDFHIDHCHSHEKKVSSAAKWGYGVIATAIISLFSIFGVFIVLFRNRPWYPLALTSMVALAMGCLLSDATLHLIPLALGVHKHDHGSDGHAHAEAPEDGSSEEMSDSQIRSITIAITFGVYLFLLFEKLLHVLLPHDHGHGNNEVELKETPKKNTGQDEKDLEIKERDICSVDSVAWMIIFGDGLHNFADGLVMGAAFTQSLATGLGTSIAVFCHEVPHELGDFAVLLNSGMKLKWAVLFNFLSACTCFLGLFVGLAIGENDSAQKWIFAFTAGMFIYIACSDLIPEMERNYAASNRKILVFFLQQVGFIIGFLIMFLIALYEHDLEAIGGGGHAHEH